MSQGFNYGNAQTLPGAVEYGGYADEPAQASQEIDAGSLEIGGYAIEHDADVIEQAAKDREYLPLPPGHHTLVVAGFGKVVRGPKEVYLTNQKDANGRPLKHTFIANSVSVRLASTQDPRYQVTDVFILPPDGPQDIAAYNYGSTKPDGSTAGFHSEKFAHFINRLIGGFSKGQPIPPAARKLQNWVGRQVDAEVVMSKERVTDQRDPQTGKNIVWPARAQVKLYSYRACGTVQPQAGQPPTGQPTGQTMGHLNTAPTGMPRGVRNI